MRNVAAVLVLLASCVCSLKAQQTGILPFHAYDQTLFDTVDLASDTVQLHIPIVSYPQKGSLPPVQLQLIYNSPWWTQEQFNTCPTCQPQGNNYIQWVFDEPNFQPYDNGIGLIQSPSYGTGSVVDVQGGQGTDGNPPTLYLPTITDSTGAVHIAYNTTIDGALIQAAGDGSGLLLFDGATVIDRNGVRYSNGTMQDPNGNKVITSSSQITDSLGRVIPLFSSSDPAYFNTKDGGGPSCDTKQFPSFGGGTAPITVCFQYYTAQSAISAQYVQEGNSHFIAIASITLQNGTSWAFDYDSWGSLHSVTSPTGAVMTYNYQTSSSDSMTVNRYLQSRVLSVNGKNYTWSYQRNVQQNQSTVTDPSDNVTTYTFGGAYGQPVEVQYKDSQGNILKTVQMISYGTSGGLGSATSTIVGDLPKATITTIGSGASAVTTESCTVYDNDTDTTCTGTSAAQSNGLVISDPNVAGQTAPLVLGTPLYTYTWDYGSPGSGTAGGLLRSTHTTYEWQANTQYLDAGLLSLPASTSISLTPGGTVLASTTYNYDEANGSPAGVHGNLTSVIRMGAAGETQTVYNANGLPTSITDNLGHIKTITYDTATGAYPATVQQGPLADSYSYNTNTGVMTAHTDSNNQTTSYNYDAVGRLLSVTYPSTNGGQGQETYSYSDTAPNPSVQYTKKINGSTLYVATTLEDALGRAVQTQITSSPGGTVYTDKTYDGLGNLLSVSNPYRSTSESTYGVTSYQYDALGRRIFQCNQDNTPLGSTTCTPNNSDESWTYTGNITVAKDANGNSSQYTYDALARLTSVIEPGSLQANYTYDPLGDLVEVNQLGKTGDSPRVRTFSYDSLSRLVSATNPETGTVSYGYDADGNLITKTDARGITVSYAYDNLNRLYQKRYWENYFTSPVSTNDPTVCMQYDATGSAASGNPNPVGRLTMEWTQASGTSCPGPSNPQQTPPANSISSKVILGYDAVGRLTGDQQCPIGGNCAAPYAFDYGYDLAGDLTSESDPIPIPGNTTPLVLSKYVNGVQQLDHLTVTGQPSATYWNTTNFTILPTLLQASPSTGYDAFGNLVNASLGISTEDTEGAVGIARQFNNRDWITSETDTGMTQTAPPSQSSGSITVTTNSQAPTYVNPTTATSTVTIGGYDQSTTVDPCGGTCPFTVYDSGTVTLTINGTAVSVGYSSDTSDSIASSLAAAVNQASVPVTASVSGSVITLTAKTSGAAGNSITISASSQTDDPSDFYTASFYAATSGGTLTGGSQGTPVYDTGTISAVINGQTATASWSADQSAATVATNLASAIASTDSTFLSASASGSTILLTSLNTGPATNWAVGTSTTYNTSQFSSPGFGSSASGMSGGSDGQFNNATVYSYAVPQSGGYQHNGNLASYADSSSTGSVMGTWSFQYDTLNRLTGANVTAGPYSGLQASWSYDDFGNRTAESFGGTTTHSMPTSSTATYDGNNRISNSSLGAIQYDPSGDGDVIEDNLNRYAYDGEGRICAVQSLNSGLVTGYLYDAEGVRVVKGDLSALACPNSSSSFSSVTAEYLLGPGGEQVTELNGSGGWVHTNVWAAGKLDATYDVNGLHFHVSDPLGTRRVQIAGGGASPGCIENSFQSLPYGGGYTANPGCASGDDATEHHFTGKERDSESGNDYFGARYYASSMGRFLSPDPAGVAFSNVSNPQSWNLYSYVQNNPLNRVDPDGRECVWDDGSFDSKDDPQTGSISGCENAGGTYYDPSTFTAGNGQDWSSAPNAMLAAQVAEGEALAASLPQGPDPSSASGGNSSTNGNTTTVDLWGLNWFSSQVSTGTHPWRDNNPGDITSGPFTGRNGQLGTDGRFAVFPTSGTGSQALNNLLSEPGYQNLSIDAAVAKYAPAFENNTASYQQFLINAVGVSGNTPLSSLSSGQMQTLENAISRYEGFNASGNFSVTTTSVITPP